MFLRVNALEERDQEAKKNEMELLELDKHDPEVALPSTLPSSMRTAHQVEEETENTELLNSSPTTKPPWTIL